MACAHTLTPSLQTEKEQSAAHWVRQHKVGEGLRAGPLFQGQAAAVGLDCQMWPLPSRQPQVLGMATRGPRGFKAINHGKSESNRGTH